MNMNHNDERSLTGNALVYAFDHLFARKTKSLQLFLLALAAAAINQLVKGIVTLSMIARYGHSGDTITFFPPAIQSQYLMRNDAYVEMEPAFLWFFYVIAFTWLCLILIPALHKLILNYYDTGSLWVNPFVTLRQMFAFGVIFAIAIAVKQAIQYIPGNYLESIPFYILLLAGLLLTERLMFVGYYIIDQNKGPFAAIQASCTLTKWFDASQVMYRLAVTMFIILNLQVVLVPFFTSEPLISEGFWNYHFVIACVLFNTWVHWLAIGLMSSYAYRQF
jgi:hypothetical protein